MRKWFFVGLALLAFSGLIGGISLNLAILASESPLGHDRYLWTTHVARLTWYAALGVQLIGAWVYLSRVPYLELEATEIAAIRSPCRGM